MINSLNEVPEIMDYLHRIGAYPTSMRKAVIGGKKGNYTKDRVTIQFQSSGVVDIFPRSAEDIYKPNGAELERIVSIIRSIGFPTSMPAGVVEKNNLLSGKANPDFDMASLSFPFYSLDGTSTLFVQQKVETLTGKQYLPWSFWSDGKWRMMEPDGLLPLYNLPGLAEHEVAFIHEGAKSAQFCSDLISGESSAADHPWGEELLHAAHIGWAGGALNPHKTDWRPLINLRRAYVVCDNDTPGLRALRHISKVLRCVTFSIQFTDQFPEGFDLGDSFPKEFYSGNNYYIGPSFRDCLHPATWATDTILVPGSKRPSHKLRQSFKDMWSYVEEADVYVCKELPYIIREEKILKNMLMAFSDVKDTLHLMHKEREGDINRLAYRPDVDSLIINDKGFRSINIHIPTHVRPDASIPIRPWLEFLQYLIVKTEERIEVERWCATLIARPDIKMGYGLLLASEMQGIGKTTLGLHVLAPLVGYYNYSVPNEEDINSSFNEWISHKRLAVIGEIYSGHSWKVYNKLKTVITDATVSVNRKFMRQYEIDNFIHIFACSNSMRAIRMDEDDRRWYYPELASSYWGGNKDRAKANFERLYDWLKGGGLSAIMHWAKQLSNHVQVSEFAPMTLRKRELIDDSVSIHQRESARIANIVSALQDPCVIFMRDVAKWVVRITGEKLFDSLYQLRRCMRDVPGITEYEERIRMEGELQYALMNDLAYREIQLHENKNDRVNAVRKYRTLLTDIDRTI